MNEITAPSEWKERVKEEYSQTKSRYEKLKSCNNKLEIKDRIGAEVSYMSVDNISKASSIEECRKDSVRRTLLREQQRAMGEYLHILELRAELEGITLE